MSFSVGVLRGIFPLQWWLLLVCIHGATVFGQVVSLVHIRPMFAETIPKDLVQTYNSNQTEDSVPALENYNANLDPQQPTLNFEEMPEYHNTKKETLKPSYNDTNDDKNKSDGTLEDDNIQKFLQSNNPPEEGNYGENGPNMNSEVAKPMRKDVKIKNVYYKPYSVVQRTDPLLQVLGSHSDEVIQQILETGRNKIVLKNKDQLKNAFLTKFTSYNITQLVGNKHNKSFLLEKKDNTSSDINFVDSKNRPTNYSDQHSSLLKTIIEPERKVYENDQRKEGGNKNIFLKTVSSESNSSIENLLNQKNGESTNITDNNEVNKKSDTDVHWDSGSHNFIPEEIKNVAVDFVGGQYVYPQDKQNVVSLDLIQPDHHYNGPNDLLGSQFSEDSQNTTDKTNDTPGIQHEFVGGQFVKLQDRGSNKNRFSPALNSEVNSVSDFVGGQFIKYFKNEKSTTKYSNEEEYSTDNSNRKLMQKLTTSGDFETNSHVGSQSEDFTNPYTNEPRATTDFNDETTKKDMNVIDSLVQKSLNGSDLYDKESTPNEDYLEISTSPTTGDEQPTITYLTNQEGVDQESKILSDKQQPNLEEEDSIIGQENYEGKPKIAQIPLEVPKAPEIENKGKDSTSDEDKNNNYISNIKKVKLTKPLLIPYSRSRIPYRIRLYPYSKLNPRPIKVFSVGNNIYIPQLTQNMNGRGRLSPNYKDNIVIKTNDDDDTEVIVSVSDLPDDQLQNQLPISETNSTFETQKNVDPLNDTFSESNKLTLSMTEKPNITIENKTLNSEYDEYEDDDLILGNSNLNKTESILVMDPNSNQYFTELVANYFKTEFSTEPNIIKDTVILEEVSSALPTQPDPTIDNIVGESSNFLPNQMSSQSFTPSFLLNIDAENKLFMKPNISSQNVSGSSKITENVELYAGDPLNIAFNNTYEPLSDTKSNIQGSDNINFPSREFLNDDKNSKDHLAELCIPLTKEKYVSLLDLLSGPFYFDRNGKKIAIAFRGDQSKNCTLNSKECKLFVDFKNMSNPLIPDDSLELIRQADHQHTKHEKRNIYNEMILNYSKMYPSTKKISSESYKNKFNEQNNGEKLNFNNQLPEDVMEKSLKHQLKVAHNSGTLSGSNKVDQKRIHEFRPISDKPPTRFDLSTRLSSVSNQNVYDLLNYGSNSINYNQSDLENYPVTQLSDKKPHNNRPVRTIDVGRSNEGEKCGCGANEILKSPSPFPNYKQFVSKRYDILKNIVHTVSDWAVN